MSGSQDARLAYEVIRSERSTADIVIERDGSVVVRAPQWADDKQVEDIVRSRYVWIYQSLAEWRDLNASRVVREYKSGEGFLYLGRTYRLLLVNKQNEILSLRNGRFCLRRDAIDAGEVASAKAAFRQFYVSRGVERLEARAKYFAPKIGVSVKSVTVRELGNRWASCGAGGALSFHWKCVMAPPTIVDYLVVHELCHFLHRDHTDAFWNEVDKVLPEYRERKNWLRTNGAGLDI